MSGDLRHPLLDAAGVAHGFGVRDSPPPPGLRRPRQVHGIAVVAADACVGEPPPAADAIVSREPGVPIGVVTADCVPILVATRDGSAVAAIHAGWRGLAAGVIESGVAALDGLATGVAVVGPHVGACCYEVDEPVWSALRTRFGAALDAALRHTRPGHAQLDLGALAAHTLVELGFAAHAVGRLEGVCTACDARQRFHSYRRDGTASGRLVHHIAVRGQSTPHEG